MSKLSSMVLTPLRPDPWGRGFGLAVFRVPLKATVAWFIEYSLPKRQQRPKMRGRGVSGRLNKATRGGDGVDAQHLRRNSVYGRSERARVCRSTAKPSLRPEGLLFLLLVARLRRQVPRLAYWGACALGLELPSCFGPAYTQLTHVG